MAKKAGNTFKLGIPQWAKPVVNVVRKVAEPVVKELVKSPPAKALFKALPQVVSPVSKSGSTGNKKITSTPKTVQPAKSVPAKAQNSSKKEVKGTACSNIKPVKSETAAQVNLQNNNNIKLSWEEMLQMYLDAVRKGETLTGAVRSLAVMSSPTLSQFDRTLKLSKIISLGAELTGAKNYYNKAAESIKGDFNDLGNQVYNAKIPFASNFVGAFTNSSDYKENGPLPLETQAENRLLAELNYLQYSKFGGGILNHADPLTTYNSIKDNTNMSSVIGANTGGFFINGAAKMADGMANICLDPYGTLEGLINLAANPKETFEAVSKGIETFSFHMVGADSQEKARLQGNILFDIASIVLFSQMGKAAEGTKGAQGANEAGGLAKRGVSINKTEAEMANASRSAGGPGVAEGAGKSVQTIKNRYPGEPQAGKEFGYTIKEGKILIDNSIQDVDFVVDMNNNLHIGRGHSFLAGGKDVQAAGTIKVNSQGYVRNITNASGHFAPTVEQGKLFPNILDNLGIRTENAWLELGDYYFTPSGYVDVTKSKIIVEQIK